MDCKLFALEKKLIIITNMVKTPKCSCPHTESLFMLLGKKWVMFILQAIDHGAHSFTEIRRDIGDCNTKILTDRLTELVERGVLVKSETSYTLSKSGKELTGKLLDVADWWASQS